LKTAKEIWGTLREIFEGDVSVQRSRLALLKTEVNMFVRKDGESADQVFRRLKSIVLDLRNYGCTWADDNFIKDRFLCAMILTDETMVTMIYQRMDFDQLTPNQIVSSFTTKSLLKTKSKQTHDLVHGINSSNNLALKAKKVASPSKVVEVEDVEEYCEEEDVPSCPANDFEEDVVLLVRKYGGTMGTLGNKGSNNFKGKTFGRRKCYNCDSPKHFVADCPYERREEKSEKLILKKKRFNKFAKRRGDKALVHEEYLSEDEEDGDDDEHKGMAAIAMHSKSSSTSSSLFDSPNENKTIVHRCLMAREVISKSINSKPSPNTTNSLQEESDNECDDDGVDYSEEASLAFMKTLKGESLARFLNMMRSLTERDDYIGNVETLLMEEKERNDLLEQNLLEVENMKASLEETVTSNEIDFVKVNDALELSLEIKHDLLDKIAKLKVDHSELGEEYKLLEKSHKLIKGELITLTESYNQLKASTLKTLATFSPNDACASNSIDYASLLVENKKLKEQLEKGLVSCIQGEKNLNELLSNQKECVAKEGIGFDPSQKKKKNKHKKKKNKKKKHQATPPQQQITFVQEGHKEKEKGKEKVGEEVISKEVAPSSNYAGINNPSYVLMRRNDGYTFAKFVGTNYDDYAWTIWVPKTLVANSLGPIEKWGPKNKA